MLSFHCALHPPHCLASLLAKTHRCSWQSKPGLCSAAAPGAPMLPCALSAHPSQKSHREVTEKAGFAQDFSIGEVCTDAILAQKLVSSASRQVPRPLPLTASPEWGWLMEPRWERRSWKAPCFQAAYSIALTQPPAPLAWHICERLR